MLAIFAIVLFVLWGNLSGSEGAEWLFKLLKLPFGSGKHETPDEPEP